MRALFFLLMFVPLTAAAQGGLDAERSSLNGIRSFEADITIEGPRHLVQSDVLQSEVLLHRVVSRLRNAGLEVARATPGSSETPPSLQVHVNLLEVGAGLVPFTVSAGFYQDVRLAAGGREMSAITWDESVLGVVSQNLIQTIAESIDGLVDQFVEDYLAANRR